MFKCVGKLNEYHGRRLCDANDTRDVEESLGVNREFRNPVADRPIPYFVAWYLGLRYTHEEYRDRGILGIVNRPRSCST